MTRTEEIRIKSRRLAVGSRVSCGLPAVDSTASKAEQERQAAAADHIRSNNLDTEDLLYDLIELRTGQRPTSREEATRAINDGDAADFAQLPGSSAMAGHVGKLAETRWVPRVILPATEAKRIRAKERPALEHNPPGGETKASVTGYTSEGYRVLRFSGYDEVDEMQQYDDVLQFWTLLSFQMGKSAGTTEGDCVYSVLLSNPELDSGEQLFSDAHANTLTGAPISASNLGLAMAKLIEQEEDNIKLNLQPKFLLVPPVLVRDARSIARQIKNDDDGDLVVISDSRLTGLNDPVTGEAITGSDSTWYLAAPTEESAIELGFFGSDRPVIGTGALDAGQWGQWFDIKHYVTAKAVRPKSIVKCTN